MTPPMLRHAARAALSRGRRRPNRPFAAAQSSCHDDGELHRPRHGHGPQRRHLATSTPPLLAQPNTYVAGVTPEQVAESQAMRDWYAANFKGWEDAPDKFIIGEHDVEEEADEGGEEEESNASAITLPEELTRRNIRPLVAYLREPGREEGTRACRRLRNPDVNDPYFPLVPGMLHGSDPTRGIVSVDKSSRIIVKTPWFEIQRELDRYHHGITGSFENRVYALTVFPSEEALLDHHRGRQPKDLSTYYVENAQPVDVPAPVPPPPPPRAPVPGMENILVIPADLQMHPVANASYCLNYIRYHPGKPIKIPVKLVNEEESNALKRGGFLNLVNKFVECLVDESAPIPEYLALECTGLRQKDVVRRDRLIVPEGVKIHPRVPEDYLMGTVYGVRSSGESAGGGEQGE